MPAEVQSLIAYRNSESEEAQALIAGGIDNVRWDLLSDAAKGPTVWAALARKMGPQALRMNLSTLMRHDVFNVAFHSVKVADSERNFRGAKDDNMVDYVADRIADESEIRRGKQFPYQYFAAYLNADDNVPQRIKTALHKAAEIACGNVPELPGPDRKCEDGSSKFEIGDGNPSNFELLNSNFIRSVRYVGLRVMMPRWIQTFDPEHRGAIGQVRWWWNRLFAAAGSCQPEACEAQVRRNRSR